MALPLISILTPSFNQGRFIAETLDSVLHQDDPNVEHLVMDGGSTDETVSILEGRAGDPNLKWWSEPDHGQSHAVNKLLGRARGDIIGWLNSDDCYRPAALERVRDVFETTPSLVVYGDYDETDANSRLIKHRQAYEGGVESFVMFWEGRANIGQPAVFWRRSLSERIGELNESLHNCMDWDYWVRARRHGPFVHCGQTLATCRLHAEAKTARIEMARETVYHVGRYINWLPLKRQAEAHMKLAARQSWHEVQERASDLVFEHFVDRAGGMTGDFDAVVVYGCGLNARRISGRLMSWAFDRRLPLHWADDAPENPYLYWTRNVCAPGDALARAERPLVFVTPWADAHMRLQLRDVRHPDALTLCWRDLYNAADTTLDIDAAMEAAYA